MPVWEWIEKDRKLQPAKPTLDAEPNYEDHPVNPWPKWDPALGYFRDWDVRKQTYRSVFAGACGVTYGHHSVWQFWSPREEKINHADRYWTEAIDRPGAFQVGYLRRLVESRPMLKRIPDPSLLLEGQGKGSEHAVAMRSENGDYAMIYIPTGKTVKVNFANLKGKEFVAWWFDPRTGKTKKIGCLENPKTWTVTTPTLGAEQDWVLILDDKAARFSKPGK